MKSRTSIIRATSAANQRTDGPSIVPERVIKAVLVKANRPGGRGAQITYDQTVTTKGVSKHYRVMVQFETSPLTRMGTWG